MVPGSMPTRLHAALALLIVPAALVSCRTLKFYSQAVHGQWEVLSHSRPISQVEAAKDSSPELRRQLALVNELRQFAHDELKLPTHRQFRSYADLGRPYVVWNVVASPEFSLDAKTWSYPLLGKLKYRGFFTEKAALGEAARLKAQGLDVAVGGVRVYSTLGVFRDPVLNTFIKDDETELAETLFHELTHARLYLNGDTDFNEAYATASAQLGVRAWLRAKGDHAALARYERSLKRISRVLGLVSHARSELATLYGQRGSISDDDLRTRKRLIFSKLQSDYTSLSGGMPRNGARSGWVTTDLNNARLVAVATYYDLVPAFTRLFESQDGNWERFHQAVAALKPLSRAARRQTLASAAPAPPNPGPN